MRHFSRHATLEWSGDVAGGTGPVSADSSAFSLAATFPRIAGDPPGTTTPEELLAASHTTCFGIGLRSILAQRGGSAVRLRVTATITAEKERGAIRITKSHLEGTIEGVAGVDTSKLQDIAAAAESACTISTVLRATVPVTVSVCAA